MSYLSGIVYYFGCNNSISETKSPSLMFNFSCNYSSASDTDNIYCDISIAIRIDDLWNASECYMFNIYRASIY